MVIEGTLLSRRRMPWLLVIFSLLLCLMSLQGGVALARAPYGVAAHPSYRPWTAFVAAADRDVTWIHVRTAPNLHAPIIGREIVGTPVTVYGALNSHALHGTTALWYRISPLTAPGRYIYGQYVWSQHRLIPTHAKVIVVSLSRQYLVAMQDGSIFLTTPVTTGRPALPTPLGIYPILGKFRHKMFISPWPRTSPNYYAPSQTNYALQFRADGYYIHDSPWRRRYGPGTNLPHDDPSDPLGSHGCVNIPTAMARLLYAWADAGTMVEIVN